MITTYKAPIAITTAGIGGTVMGCLRLADGHIAEGAGALFLGMTATNFGGRAQGLDLTSHSALMKYTLGAGTNAIGAQGALRLANGVRQKSAIEITKGIIQTTAGIAGTAFVYSLDSRSIVTAHQASAIALSSLFIEKLGFDDLTKGRYLPGLCKIALGFGGMLSAGYYVYSACSQPDTLPIDPISLSGDQTTFLEDHKAEIEEMYEKKTSVGNWTTLGSGISKTTFRHPDLPKMVIKIPNDSDGFRRATCEDDLRLHYANLQQIQSSASQFDRIVLPKSHLYLTSRSQLLLVEEELDLTGRASVPNDPDMQKTTEQFYAFKKATRLCDMDIEQEHNAGFLSRTTPPKIGVIDFDCVCGQSFILQDRDCFVEMLSTVGTTVAKGVIAVAKKIASTDCSTILQLGFGLGTVMAVAEGITTVAKKITQLSPSTTLLLGMGIGAITALCLASQYN